MRQITAVIVFALSTQLAHAATLRHAGLGQDTQDATAMAATIRLANAGDPEATYRLGEMAWYGINQPADRAKGDLLFAKAAAAGSASARQALALSAQRAAHLDEIAYWTARYDGAELESGKFQCDPAAIPRRSESRQEVAAVNQSYDRFAACHNGFVDHLATVTPTHRIPDAIADVMSDAELSQAYERVKQVVASLAAKHQAIAKQVLAEHDAWAFASNPDLQTQQARLAQMLADGQNWRERHERIVLDRPRFPVKE